MIMVMVTTDQRRLKTYLLLQILPHLPQCSALVLCLLWSQGKVLFLHHVHTESKRRGRVLVSEKGVPCGHALGFWKLPTKISLP